MKKLIAILLSAVLFCSAFTVFAADESDSQPETEPISQGELIPETELQNGLKYQGFSYDELTITGYSGNDSELIIPKEIGGKTVIQIESGAFKDNSVLKSVVLPNSIKNLGNNAFENCTSLESVTLPENLNRIESHLFAGCTSLKELAIPSTVKSIGTGAFKDSAIKELALPDEVTEIGSYAFQNCKFLRKISVDSAVNSIGTSAFDNCENLENVDIKDLSGWCRISFIDYKSNPLYYAENLRLNGSVITDLIIPYKTPMIYPYAFSHYMKLKSVTINSDVITIAHNSFYWCRNLEQIFVGDSVERIDTFSFMGCPKLTGLRLGEGLKSIGKEAFAGCDSLMIIAVPKNVESIGADAFKKYNSDPETDGTAIYGFPSSEGERYANYYGIPFKNISEEPVPEGVLPTSPYIEKPTEPITSEPVTEPIETTPSPADYSYRVLNDNSAEITSFKGRYGNIVIPNELDGHKVTSIEPYVFRFDYIKSITLPNTITVLGERALASCEAEEIILPDTLTEIGKEALDNCDNLTDIKIPNNVKIIGEQAFFGCKSLKEIKIPESVTEIGDMAFALCEGLTTISIPKNVNELTATFCANCFNLKAVEVAQENPNYLSENGVLYSKDKTQLMLYPAAKEDKSFTVPAEVEEIFGGAFHGNKSLVSVTVPDRVKTLRGSVFEDCTALETAVIPSEITEIPDYLFFGCKSLKAAVIPDNVKTIGIYAFGGCKSIKTVTLPENVKTLGDGAFSSCTSLSEINLNENLKYIGDYAFLSCTAASVTIPQSVLKIGEQAFGYYRTNPETAPYPIYTVNRSFIVRGKPGTEAQSYAVSAMVKFESTDKTQQKAKPTFKAGKTSLKAGQSTALTVSDGKPKTLTSSDKKTVKIKNGKAYALKKGTASITATLTDGTKLTVKIKVTSSPKLSKKSITLKKGKTQKVKIIGKSAIVNNKYKSAKTAKITSSKTAETIKIRGLKKGRATLYITVNGVKLSLKVKVR